MNEKTILLIEDNADDEALTLRALKINNISNQVAVARDGVEGSRLAEREGKLNRRAYGPHAARVIRGKHRVVERRRDGIDDPPIHRPRAMAVMGMMPMIRPRS